MPKQSLSCRDRSNATTTMNQEKLKALRDKFGNASAFEIFDADLKQVAESLLDGELDASGRRKLPFSGVSTLLSAPFQQSLDNLDVALVGVPMDLGVTNRTGARYGPRAIRDIDRIGPYNEQLGIAPKATIRYADIGDSPIHRFSLEKSMEEIEGFFHTLIDAGVKPLSAGGDHSITYPILKAVGRDTPVGCVHIDAHCDTSGEFDDTKFHHGGPFRTAVLDGVLDPERTIQIGIRGASEIRWEFSYASGMTVLHIHECMEMGAAAIAAKARSVVGDGPVYVSIDVDGFDPTYAPGTGTPEVGGLTPREGQQILRGLRGIDVVGGDVVEVAPQYDPTTNTAMLGAQLMFEVLCLMA